MRVESTLVRAGSAPGERSARLIARWVLVSIALLAVLSRSSGSRSPVRPRGIADGVAIAGVDVGGLTPKEARALLEQRFDRGRSRAGRVHGRRRELSDQGDNARRRGRLGVGDSSRPPARARASARSAASAGCRRASSAPRSCRRSRPTRPPSTTSSRVWPGAIDQSHVEAKLVRRGLSIEVVPGQAGLQLDRKAAEAGSSARSPGSSAAAPLRCPSRIDRSRSAPPSSLLPLARLGSPSRRPSGSSTRARAGSCRAGASPSSSRCPRTARPQLAIAGPGAEAWFTKLRKTVEHAPVDATLRGRRRRRDRRSSRTSPASASTCPRPRRRSSLPRPRRRLGPPSSSVRTTVAERTAAEAQAMGITGVVGSYYTTYGGIASRLHNVALVAQLIDGALIAPGKTFSFNGTTGERTAEKGFQEAPVIINGELQTGLGGGICQVSTTVFNAAYEAGLADRRAHEPRALHLALPARARRDGQLPRSRPQVHERHRQVAARCARSSAPARSPSTSTGRLRTGGSSRASSRSASSAHRR